MEKTKIYRDLRNVKLPFYLKQEGVDFFPLKEHESIYFDEVDYSFMTYVVLVSVHFEDDADEIEDLDNFMGPWGI